LGIQGAFLNSALSHARIFNGLQVCFWKIKDIFKAIWLVTIWMIWKARNDWFFNQKAITEIRDA
jgi:hypothetical protein